jgi:hypothetical protein
MENAVRTSTIVSSLFPAAVRDRILAAANVEAKKQKSKFSRMGDEDKREEPESRPIADLFPGT